MFLHKIIPPVEVFLEILQWLSRLGIENLLTYALRSYLSSFLWANICGLFPYNKQTVDEWFTLKGKRKNALNIKNVSKEVWNSHNSHRSLYHSIPSLSSLDDNFKIFFHSTKHDSAKNIIEKGIILRKGGRFKDFSDGWGFYLGNDLEDALSATWARNKSQCSAVLVFLFAKAELKDFRNLNGADLQADIDEWKYVVRECRTTDRFPSEEFRKKYEHYDFIEGPLFGEGQGVTDPIPNDDSYQLCIKSTVCAKLFDKNLHSVFFLESKR